MLGTKKMIAFLQCVWVLVDWRNTIERKSIQRWRYLQKISKDSQRSNIGNLTNHLPALTISPGSSTFCVFLVPCLHLCMHECAKTVGGKPALEYLVETFLLYCAHDKMYTIFWIPFSKVSAKIHVFCAKTVSAVEEKLFQNRATNSFPRISR